MCAGNYCEGRPFLGEVPSTHTKKGDGREKPVVVFGEGFVFGGRLVVDVYSCRFATEASAPGKELSDQRG